GGSGRRICDVVSSGGGSGRRILGVVSSGRDRCRWRWNTHGLRGGQGRGRSGNQLRSHRWSYDGCDKHSIPLGGRPGCCSKGLLFVSAAT
ncbi:hypothetical protein TNCV_4208641, partial [Trichonephila clavipes]